MAEIIRKFMYSFKLSYVNLTLSFSYLEYFFVKWDGNFFEASFVF